jgi:UDP-N-acetylmuramoyl-tripeptide--D-alanyl-D-alanine ligase
VKNANREKIKAWLQKLLKLTSVLILKKYNPRIISITGSVGKTSTKEAVFVVLAGDFRVRRGEKNYNNEIGLPLAIIGADSGQGSILGWLKVFIKGFFIIIFPIKYPEVLILEMGADRPGDIQYLTGFIESEIGIVTDISSSHLEFFKNLEAVAKEKWILIRELDKKSLAVINIDNEYMAKLKNQTEAKVITYGFSKEADIRATDVAFLYDENNDKQVRGLSFKLNYQGTSIPVRLNNVLAKHLIYPVLAATAAGTWFGLNLVEIGAALENFCPLTGRMNLIAGIKNTAIIDDTYNSSPTSSLAAMETLAAITLGRRKIVVLGDMLELGNETESGHRKIAKKFLEIGGDVFLAVGERMQLAVAELEKNNFSRDKIFSFKNPTEAVAKLREIILDGDVILVKGSQGMRMEKIVEGIMIFPQKAVDLLCRQNTRWKETPFKEI